MELQQVVRTDPDKIFINVLNCDVDSITTGYAACIALGANSFNGAQVMKTDGDALDTVHGFVGIAESDIAPNSIGRVQVWGFANSVFISHEGTSITINRGNCLVPGKVPGGLCSVYPTIANSMLKYVICSNPPVAVSAAGWCSGFVRCL